MARRSSGAALKFTLGTRAGYNQPLSYTPVRGRGVAGPAV